MTLPIRQTEPPKPNHSEDQRPADQFLDELSPYVDTEMENSDNDCRVSKHVSHPTRCGIFRKASELLR